MSVCYDKVRKKYYISYKIKLDNGEYKTFNIRNKEWTKSLGKRYVMNIEQEEIEKDVRKRKLHLHNGDDITLTDLTDLFLTEVKSVNKTQTAYNKGLMINKYITSYFNNHLELSRVFSARTIESFRNSVVALGNIQPIRKNRILKVLLEMLEYATDHEYISYELFRRCKAILKPVREQNTSKGENIVYWTNEQWSAFISTFNEDDKWKYLFETAYVCGLRIGELIALKWSDLNLVSKSIRINKSMDSAGNLEDTKTKSSNANVSISQELSEDFKKLKELLYGDKETCIEDEYIFFGYNHTSRTTIRRIMDLHSNKANIPHIKFHGLRHSCASRLINAGVSPLIVSKHLRHSSVKETLDTYAHIFPSETIGYVDKVFN